MYPKNYSKKKSKYIWVDNKIINKYTKEVMFVKK